MKNISALCLVFLFKILPAQSPILPRFTLKTDALALINPVKIAVTLSSDIRVGRRISVDAGLGAIVESTNFAYYKGESYKGLRLRLGGKYWIPLKEALSFHLGLEAKYNDVRHVELLEITRQGFQYSEIYPVKRTVETWGLAVRTGWVVFLGKNNRIFLDFFSGLGFAVHQVGQTIPKDAEILDTNRFILDFKFPNGRSTTLSLPFGIYFGLTID